MDDIELLKCEDGCASRLRCTTCGHLKSYVSHGKDGGHFTHSWRAAACDCAKSRLIAAGVAMKSSIAALTALTAECDGLKAAQLVPGKMYCAKCKLSLISTKLYLRSGTTGPGDSATEHCPNGCGPLWPVTWEKSARDSWTTCEEIFEREQAEKARVVDLRKTIEHCVHSMEVARIWDGMKWHWSSLHWIPAVDVWTRLRAALSDDEE